MAGSSVVIPWVGLSLMLEDDFRVATAPLFVDELVDVLEWSFDTGWGRSMPPWAEALLDFYADAGRLLGHGVHYSPLSATWEPRQARWLEDLARELARRRYVHVTEHYGFMTAPPFTRGAPLPLPRSEATLAVGRDRLRRLRDVTSSPLGLENLALAWNRDEALAHGAWLDALLTHDDDFIVLDVHNLFCQLANFELGADEALDAFPLERVREIHVSGGSDLPAWPDGPSRVRCDTHDDRVPEAVFELLSRALARCPNVIAVIFERLGGTIRNAAEAEAVREDFRRVRAIAAAPRVAPAVAAPGTAMRNAPGRPVIADDVAALARLESALLTILADGGDVGDTTWEGAGDTEHRLRWSLEREPAVAPYRELFASADGRALGIAARVVKKYARRQRG
jgi:uncharacterized protein (UPF0276 family)